MVDHYYTESPKSEMRLNKVSATLRGDTFQFFTSSGVFSIKRVDKGTEILVENMIVPKGGRVLDLGCGYGVVGIVVKQIFPSTEVVMSDINRRAVELAKRNLELNKVDADVRQGDSYSGIRKDERFDAILLNPPQTAGREVCFKMIEDAVNFLNPEGTLQLVARHNKGGKVLSEKMGSVFGNVETITKKSGYRVYVSKLF